MEDSLIRFRQLSFGEAALVFLVANAGIFVGSCLGCWLLARWFPRQRLFDRWEPFRAPELAAALGAVLLNVGVSMAGWALWTHGWITLRPKPAALIVFDTLLMVAAMDLGMYLLHRVAHTEPLFGLVHRFHHRHEVVNPISLFVLHPLEVAGFGALMIGFLMVYPIAPPALMAYLALNVAFGTLGHCGVEPFPPRLALIPLAGWAGTSTFHAEHHERPAYNFGFYTLLWDRWLGTLDPEYARRYAAAARRRP